MQDHLELIPHVVDREIIQQRSKDGYINATAMCKAAGKLWADYRRLKQTGEFLDALAADMGIPILELVQSLIGGSRPELQGTWVHPQLAINLAQWLSPQFAVQVARWVHEWISGNARPGPSNLPYHLQRYLVNNERVPAGYFCVLSELAILVIAPLESMGYRLPPELVPDISSGRLWCKWLRNEKGINTDDLPFYWHAYQDGRQVPAKLYPEALLPEFRKHIREVWLPLHAEEYFRKRSPAALQHLPRLLTLAKPDAPVALMPPPAALIQRSRRVRPAA